MTTSQQKELELAHLVKALKLLGFMDYSIIDKDSESPDFLIKLNGQTIGVEVTNIYRDLTDGNSAKTQSDLPIITEESINIYNNKGGIPLVFYFSFNGNVVAANRREIIKNLADFLYEYTKMYFPEGVDTIQEININQTNKESLFIINSIFVQQTDSATAVSITVSVFDSAPAEPSVIERTLRKKELLLPKYKERCNNIWLLMVLPSMQLAADLKLQENQDVILAHEFDVAYILDDYRDNVKCINKA